MPRVVCAALASAMLLILNSHAAIAADPVPASAEAAKAATSSDSAELRAFKKAIGAKYALKEKAFAAHDAETIVTQFYSADVISVGEGEGIFIGRDQIRADFHVTPGQGEPFTFAILFLWSKVNGDWICKGDFFVNGSFREGKLAKPAAPEAN